MLKVAVIGVGSMGRNHARVYAELEKVDLVAVADANNLLATEVADKYGVRSYTDYRTLLEQERPDAVSVVVPTALHEEVGSAALQSGAHVLIEKPIASTVEGGQRLIELSKEHNRKLMIGHIVRFNPAIQALREKLQAEELGRIFQIVCRRIGPFPARIRDVGVVIDLASHDLDIMRYLSDSEPTRVYAEIERKVHTKHEDLVLGLLRFENGMTGCLETNWLSPNKVREIIVLGERGMFIVNDLTQDLFYYENSDANGELWPALGTIKGVSEGSMTRYQINRQEPLKRELEAFVNSIVSDINPPVTGDDGLTALKLAQALIQSGKTHKVIDV